MRVKSPSLRYSDFAYAKPPYSGQVSGGDIKIIWANPAAKLLMDIAKVNGKTFKAIEIEVSCEEHYQKLKRKLSAEMEKEQGKN